VIKEMCPWLLTLVRWTERLQSRTHFFNYK